MLAAVTPSTRLIFVCSPGNPTANCVREADVLELLENYTTGMCIAEDIVLMRSYNHMYYMFHCFYVYQQHAPPRTRLFPL